MTSSREGDSNKVWTALITNTKYLPGLLTLEASLRFVRTKYPFVVLYTDAFPPEGHAALDRRGIAKRRIPCLLPNVHKDYSQDPRFYDCWSKLAPYGLEEYERVVQLDSDMLVLQNMDELMEIPLDERIVSGEGERVFAASHACVCNPLGKPHYPKNWVPGNCAFTSQHSAPDKAQEEGASPTAGLAMPNGGLQVVVPSPTVYERILSALQSDAVASYDFADQSMLGDLFYGRWATLPYIYNALKTLRWPGVHDAIWRDAKVKNVHYILSPKPWEESEEERRQGKDESHKWWWEMNERRLADERARGVSDVF
ncbi:glycosyltransferase family 8 protein [Piedraia hortae CBS 480.64]|uniref:Glycosyltransferase family 8 protein n=1 Tax=Piedraia hortae CBS 480.64 TaxID=1314780 RepID=A0A6A7BTD0_9PEZI|nr:glycosyltransferase family 8 protein [Piedraia hortae CBS 480.64]